MAAKRRGGSVPAATGTALGSYRACCGWRGARALRSWCELLEGLERVLERVDVHRLAGRDDPLDRGRYVPDVHVHPGRDAAVAEPERDELAAGTIAAEDDRIVGRRAPGVLHADVVLVGIEVRDAVVPLRLSEHVRCGDSTLALRVIPVLDTQASTVAGMPRVGDVAGGEDARGGGLESLVDEDAVLDPEPGLTRELDPRLGTDADHDQAGGDGPSVCQSDATHLAVAVERGRCGLADEADPLLLMGVAIHGAELGPEHV